MRLFHSFRMYTEDSLCIVCHPRISSGPLSDLTWSPSCWDSLWFLALFLISSNDQVLAQSGVWITKTPMPTARNDVMAAGLAGKLYVVGGKISCCDANMLNILEVYDPVTDTWTPQAPMHEARRCRGLSGHCGQILCGRRADSRDRCGYTGSVRFHDGHSGPRRHRCQPRGASPAVEAIGGLLYVAGGSQEGTSPRESVDSGGLCIQPPIPGRRRPPYLHHARRWRPASSTENCIWQEG